MQANTPYALHDDAARPQLWAAHVRLTPELLLRLQQVPDARVTLALGGGRSKRPSVLSVDADPVERYELLSFPEDARVTHVCALRYQGGDGGGYALEAAGRAHQKLIVQRLLDSVEKGRMKDRHAQSVRESRARVSKLLDEQPPAAANKRRRVGALVGRSDVGSRAEAAAAAAPPPPRMVLRSALSAEEAQRARETIEKGFEPEVAAVVLRGPQAVETERGADGDGGGDALFSSDSDGSDGGGERKQREAADGAREATVATEDEKRAAPQKPKATVDAPSAERRAAAAAAVVPSAEPVKQPERVVLPKVKNPAAAAETKRPLPRASRIPDLSFFPLEVASICKRVAAHITRSAVLDDADYRTFEAQYDAFFADWETLDKARAGRWSRCRAVAYSIEVIKAEGLPVRLRFARDEQERAALEKERVENGKRSEALMFVREAMTSIQKILASLQASITRFDRRQEQHA
ncbi:hypothetical protein PybrP1_012497 [[Pythium] brassicae (nom. inval.)]|nr:hypothetical protein PybrP1_012497 [[Pythium] brassicae (nom. inval.)]